MADIRAELASVLRDIYGDNLSELNDWLLDAETLLGSAVVARIRAEAWDEGHRFTGYEPGANENPYRQTSTHSRSEEEK